MSKYKVVIKNEKSFLKVRSYKRLFNTYKEATEWAKDYIKRIFARPEEFDYEIVIIG